MFGPGLWGRLLHFTAPIGGRFGTDQGPSADFGDPRSFALGDEPVQKAPTDTVFGNECLDGHQAGQRTSLWFRGNGLPRRFPRSLPVPRSVRVEVALDPLIEEVEVCARGGAGPGLSPGLTHGTTLKASINSQ